MADDLVAISPTTLLCVLEPFGPPLAKTSKQQHKEVFRSLDWLLQALGGDKAAYHFLARWLLNSKFNSRLVPPPLVSRSTTTVHTCMFLWPDTCPLPPTAARTETSLPHRTHCHHLEHRKIPESGCVCSVRFVLKVPTPFPKTRVPTPKFSPFVPCAFTSASAAKEAQLTRGILVVTVLVNLPDYTQHLVASTPVAPVVSGTRSAAATQAEVEREASKQLHHAQQVATQLYVDNGHELAISVVHLSGR